MKKGRRVLSTLFMMSLLILSLAACKKEKDTVILSEDDENSVAVGDRMEVILEENPSTGYSWSYTISDENGISAVEEKEIENDNKDGNDGRVGAPIQKSWIFEAVKSGTYQLEFTYYRSWEEVKPEDKKVVYTVTVE